MMRIGLLAGGIVLILDHLTKWLIRDVVLDGARYIEITGFFNLVEVWNRGVSFGLFASSSPWTPVLLSALAIGISIVLLVWLRKAETLCTFHCPRHRNRRRGRQCHRSNFMGSRFRFPDFHIAGYHWPAFNVADPGDNDRRRTHLDRRFYCETPDDG